MKKLLALAALCLASAALAQVPIYNRAPSGGGGSVDTSGVDSGFCSTQGSVLSRTATVWQCLTVGSSGDLLKSGGAAANVAWYTPPTLTGTPAASNMTYWTSATAQALLSGTGFIQMNGASAPTLFTSTGSGTVVVLATSPTLVTPVLGVASATTINKVTLTTPASGSTLTIADGKTATVNNSITLAGTDTTTMTFPSTNATIARTDAANTFTGIQTLSSPPVVAGTTAADQAAAGKVGEYQEVNCGIPAASGASLSFTNASPTVGTWTTHPFQQTNVGFSNSYACPFTITANAPTGLSTATNYWAVPIDANTFHVSTSAANAAAGTFANTSGTTATANLTNSIALTTTAGLAPVMLKLTAGDWDCQGSAIRVLGATTSVTNMQTGINSSSTAIGGLGTYFDFETAANIMTATNNPVHTTPAVRLNLSSTTAEYLVALDTFTASTNTTSGFLRCRRLR